MPKVAGIIGLTFHFVETCFNINMTGHHSDLSRNITSSANPSLNSQVRSVVCFITCSHSILYVAFLALFKLCDSLGDHLFYKQSSLRIGTTSFLLSLSSYCPAVTSTESAPTIYLLSKWLSKCPSVSYFKKIFRSWKIFSLGPKVTGIFSSSHLFKDI